MNGIIFSGLLDAALYHSILFNPNSETNESIVNVVNIIIDKFMQKYGNDRSDDELMKSIKSQQWWRVLFATRNYFGDKMKFDDRLLQLMKLIEEKAAFGNFPIGIGAVIKSASIRDRTCIIDTSQYHRFYDRNGKSIRNVAVERDRILAMKAGYRCRLI